MASGCGTGQDPPCFDSNIPLGISLKSDYHCKGMFSFLWPERIKTGIPARKMYCSIQTHEERGRSILYSDIVSGLKTSWVYSIWLGVQNHLGKARKVLHDGRSRSNLLLCLLEEEGTP